MSLRAWLWLALLPCLFLLRDPIRAEDRIVSPRSDCDLYVSHGGSNSPSCGQQEDPCVTIQQAVWNVPLDGGASICVYAGDESYGCPENGTIVNKTVALHSIEGTTVIDCAGRTRAFWFCDAGRASLKGFEIRNGFTIGSGGAILLQNSSLDLENCLFANNTASAPKDNNKGTSAIILSSGGELVMQNCTFINSSLHSGEHATAAVIGSVSATRLAIYNSSFLYTRSSNGSGSTMIISAFQTSVLDVEESAFGDNGVNTSCIFAQDIGNASFIGSNFSRNTGGGINLFGSVIASRHIRVQQCLFHRSTPAMLVAYPTTIVISDCTFNDTGPVSINQVSESCVVQNSIFANSTRSALMCALSESVTISDCYFAHNTLDAADAQAVIRLTANTNCTLEDTTFAHNAVLNGALYSEQNHELHVVRCNFTSNSALPGTTGGAMSSSEDRNVIVEHSSFTDNQAGTGAVCSIFLDGIVRFNHCRFTANMASGGSVFNIGQHKSFHINHSIIVDNRASKSIGAIDEDDNHLNNCTVVGNRAQDSIFSLAPANITDCVFRNNTITSALGIVTVRGGDLAILRSSFHSNSAGSPVHHLGKYLHVAGSSFLANTGSDSGGGVHTEFSSCVVEGTTFDNNTSSNGGGGLWIRSPGSALVNNCTFTHNIGGSFVGADGGGGIGIYFTSLVTIGDLIDIRNNTFLSNIANGGGGGVAIIHDGATVIQQNVYRIWHNMFENNTVVPSGGGGAFAWYQVPPSGRSDTRDNHISIEYNIISGNSAEEGGGVAIGYDVPSPLQRPAEAHYSNNTHTFRGNIFMRNLATTGNGGSVAIHFPEDRKRAARQALHPSNCNTFEMESLSDSQAACSTCLGGAIYLTNGITYLRSSHFFNNSAGSFGSAIGVGGGSAWLSILESRFDNNVRGDIYSLSKGVLIVDRNTTFLERGQPGVVISAAEDSDGMQLPRDSQIDCANLHLARTVFSVSCVLCPAGSYSLRVRQNLPSVDCHRCPGEAVCNGGDSVTVLPGFWCGPNAGDPTELECTACPSEYCREERAGLNDTCNGNRVGVICGSCAKGYGQAYGTEECIPDEECTDLSWFLPSALIVGLLYVLVVLCFQVNHHPLWKSITYFMQVVPLVAGSFGTRSISHVLSAFFAAFSLDPSILGISLHACPWPDMTSIQKIATDYIIPLILLGELGFILLLHSLSRWTLRKVNRLEDSVEHDDTNGQSGPLDAGEEQVEEDITQGEDTGDALPLILPREEGKGDHWYVRYASAFTGLVLLLYEGVTSATMDLLNCVDVSGSPRLFLSGDTECHFDGWQLPILLLLGLLVVFPLALVIIRGFIRKRWDTNATQAVLKVLEHPYAEKTRWWETVGLLRRVLLLTVATFVLYPIWRAAGLFALCFAALLAHLMFRPYANKHYDQVEMVFLCNLVLIAALAVPAAVYQDMGDIFSGTTADIMRWLQVLLILLPLLYCIAVVIGHNWRHVWNMTLSTWEWCDEQKRTLTAWVTARLQTRFEQINVDPEDAMLLRTQDGEAGPVDTSANL